MVPFADVFNHKASVVHLEGGFEVAEARSLQAQEGPADPDATVHVERHTSKRQRADSASVQGDASCQQGAKAYKLKGSAEQTPEDRQVASDYLGQLRPLEADDPSHAARYEDEQFYSHFPDANLRLEIAICDEEELRGDPAEAAEVLHIVAAQGVAAGAEVHNTYGEHSNDTLLAKYGFALRDNVFHAVRLPLSKFEAQAKSANLDAGRVAARLKLLQRLMVADAGAVSDRHQEQSTDSSDKHCSGEQGACVADTGQAGTHDTGSRDASDAPDMPAGSDTESAEGQQADSEPALELFGAAHISGELACFLALLGSSDEEAAKAEQAGLVAWMSEWLHSRHLHSPQGVPCSTHILSVTAWCLQYSPTCSSYPAK
jgi:hypothetical protein